MIPDTMYHFFSFSLLFLLPYLVPFIIFALLLSLLVVTQIRGHIE